MRVEGRAMQTGWRLAESYLKDHVALTKGVIAGVKNPKSL